MKRSFILNSIASETGHFLEMVHLVHRILSLQLTIVENKTFKEKRHYLNPQLTLHMKEVEKETLCLQAFIEKRVFIFNSIAFKTAHSLEVGRQCKEGSHWSVL